MDKLVTSTDTQLYVSKVREIGKRKSVDKIKLVNASLAIANRNNSNILMGLENITSDGIISPTEKKQLSLLYEQMQAENSIIMVEVEKYKELPEWKEKAEYTAKLNSYISSWTSLSDLMKEILNDMENDSYISQAQLAEVSKAYYDNLKSLDEVLQLFRYGLNRIEYRYKTTQEQVAPSAEDITDESIPTMDSKNRFLWRKQTIYYSNGKTEVTVDLIAIYGDSGEDALVCSITCDKSHVTRNDRRSDSVDYLFTINVQGYTETYTVYIDNVDITELLVDGKIVINKPYRKATEIKAEIYMAGNVMSSITLDVIDETGSATYFGVLSELPTDNSAYISGDSCVYNKVVYIFDGTNWKETTESYLPQIQISNALTSAMNDILRSLNDGDITATEYGYFKTIITNIITANYIGAKTIELQEGGCIQSLGFDPTSSNTGFKLNYDGTFQANDAIFRNVKITDGTLEAKALKTVNEDTYGAWCATSGFPSENGSWSGELQIARDGAIITIGTLSTAQTCYYDTKDWAQWMLDNIPVNNNEFTKLDGTFYGYNAYAMRFSSGDYWSTYSIEEHEFDISTKKYEFTVSFEKYYKNVSLLIEPKNASKISLSRLYVYLDGGSTNYVVDYSSGLEKYECFFGELSPGTHTIEIKGNTALGKQTLVVTTRTSIVPVYKNGIYENAVDGISSDRIMLRLYKGTDDSTVFEGGTESNPQYVCTVNGSPYGSYRYSLFQTYTTLSWYERLATNLSYNSNTLKCGAGMTGWTIPWYAKFTFLYEVGSPDSSGKVVWNTTPKHKSSCMYKVSNVFIDGVLYEKDFSVIYSGDTFNLRSEDGEINISISTSEYYSSLPSISYVEVGESQGSYVSSLYPLSAGESDIGSVNQQFDTAYINNVNSTKIQAGTVNVGTDSKVIIGQDSESGYINIYNVDQGSNAIHWHIDVYNNVLRFIRNGSTEICKMTEAGVYGAVFN